MANAASVEITRFTKEAATKLGFELCGIAPAVAGLGSDHLRAWLDMHRHGEMQYMEDHFAARSDPNLVLPGLRSVIVVGLAYRTVPAREPATGQGGLSRYCWGKDYHDVLRSKLKQLQQQIEARCPDSSNRVVVDSAPVMERDYARLAGLGWFGKHTLLINKRIGSFFFLGALLTTLELVPDAPMESQHCGTCTRCLDACPTNAFIGPYQLDPRKCISYLTIEHRSKIAEDLRPHMGSWLFGCDVCQDVCPWNRKSPGSTVSDFEPADGANPVELRELMRLSDAEFRERYRGTPLFRAKRSRLIRNALIVAVNQNAKDLLDVVEMLRSDDDPLIANTAEWAFAELGR